MSLSVLHRLCIATSLIKSKQTFILAESTKVRSRWLHRLEKTGLNCIAETMSKVMEEKPHKPLNDGS